MDSTDRDLMIANLFLLIALPLAVLGILGIILGAILGSDIILVIGILSFILLILLFVIELIWCWFTSVRDFIRELRKSRK